MLIPIIKDSNLPARVFVPCSVAFSWSISTCIGPSLCKPGGRPRAAIASVISTRPAVQTERGSKVFEQRLYHSILLIPSLQENLQHFYDMLLYRGRSRIFLRRGCTTNLTDDVKNFKSEYEEEGFWLGNNNVNCWEYISNDRADFAWLWSDCTVLIKKPQVTPEEGVRTPCTLPLDPPLLYIFKLFINTI